jgi:hypothetical protein
MQGNNTDCTSLNRRPSKKTTLNRLYLHLQGSPTTETYWDAVTGRWTPERGQLHEDIIINDLLVSKASKKKPRLWLVMGGIGSGKSTLIRSELAPDHPGAVVIDADQLWLRIPEYKELAAQDWKTAGDRTYAEVRYLRDAALAEAAARRLDIILEISGDEHSGMQSTFCNTMGMRSQSIMLTACQRRRGRGFGNGQTRIPHQKTTSIAKPDRYC